MQGMGESGDDCPFEFNFDPASFKVGDTVSYRVTGSLEGFPFAGRLVEVHDDYVIIAGTRRATTAALARAGRWWISRRLADPNGPR